MNAAFGMYPLEKSIPSLQRREPMLGGAPAPAKVWEGAHSLEWEVPSPAPYHTWEAPPSEETIARGAVH